jgi:hypothetical protein
MRSEVTKTGTVRALFSPQSGKVTLLEFSFDAVSSWRQLQHASGNGGGLKFTPTFLSSKRFAWFDAQFYRFFHFDFLLNPCLI